MPLTVIDRRAALVIVDLQVGVVDMGVPGTPDVVARSARLADAFRAHGHLVVLVNVDGGPGGRSDANPAGGIRRIPVEELAFAPEHGQRSDDLVITKHTRGAFHGTALAQELAARGVTQVVVTGIATGSGVEETAREAYAHGLNVVAVVDAMADRDPETHAFCVRKVLPKFTETATTDEVLAAL
ncbi:isochorismatase family cysteine hydrolase [Nocardioides sp.]|uniref:isochorismatase family cysteine hydrolase n=1 Tax=Nocardioides sp. TaxID=35761 RepID=UPI002D11248E|nr:isochorismatase family cysteine hydrolase [Nocardioides sp.]HVX55000.1 isochorismatase family cysteine hydrolase [Nocardioides sp.]